ncbi:MAG: polyprenyl synthetase family protein [Chloroflexi bacterium]|nr:polyprenyl synthetase family protein [Chloroflexota bacterium]
MSDHSDDKVQFIYGPIQKELSLVEQGLRGLAAGAAPHMSGLLDHVMEGRGKMVRPAITILSSQLHPGDPQLAVTMATAVELLHIATLIHDDTVDNSSVRRGRATVSCRWGKNVAVLLGDFVFALSARFVCDTGNNGVVRRFAETIMDLSSGELAEVFGAYDWHQTYEGYQERIRQKTASLFRIAAEGGAALSAAPEEAVEALSAFGTNIGMAFQIVDDILDFQGDPKEVGKPVGSDLLQGTVTLPAIMVLERYPVDNPIKRVFRGEDREENLRRTLQMIHDSTIIQDSYKVAHQFRDAAIAALHRLPEARARQSLEALAEYVTERRK